MAAGETKKEVRIVWTGFALLLAVFGSISLYKKGVVWPYFYAGSAFFVFFAAVAPTALMLLYRLWVKFATVMAWINTRVLLMIVFYFVVTPIGMLMKMLGKDLLDEKLDKGAPTYWKKREKSGGPGNYENQY